MKTSEEGSGATRATDPLRSVGKSVAERSAHYHVFPVSANLLGIGLLIISGLHVSGTARFSLADEVAWVSVFFLGCSCFTSYLAVRQEGGAGFLAQSADLIFLAGLLILLTAVVVLAYDAA